MSLRKKNITALDQQRKQLAVNVLEAKGLGNKKLSDKSFYCVINCNRVHFRTNHNDKNGKVEWNQTFTFKETDIRSNPSILRIIVFMVDKSNHESKVGEVNIDISTLNPNVLTKNWYEFDSKIISGKTKPKICLEILLITESVQVSKKRPKTSDVFKRKLSWGGKQGSQTININRNRDSIMLLDPEYNVSDDLYKDGNISSGSIQALGNQIREIESGTERELDDDQYINYNDDTDFEDAFSSPRNSINSIKSNNTTTEGNAEPVKPKRRRRKEKKIKILEVVNEEESESQETESKTPPETIAEENEENNNNNKKVEVVDPQPQQQSQQQQQTTPREKIDVSAESPKSNEEMKAIKLKKRPSLFSRQSIFKIFRGKVKDKDDHNKESVKINTESSSVKIDYHREQTKKPKDAINEHIEESIEEITSHHQLKQTIKDCKLSSKILIKQMKVLNDLYIIPGLKKNIEEFNELSKFINKFTHSYGSNWKLGRKYRDEQWKYGSFFVNLYQQCEGMFKKYKNIMSNLLECMKSDKGEHQNFRNFLESVNDKDKVSKKEAVQFEDLILSPVHHLQTLVHTTNRLSLLTPASHSEYNNVLIACREFERLNKEISNIYEEETTINETEAIEKMVYFTPSVVNFNINDGHRRLIKQGQFSILEINEDKSITLNVYAFLYNDVLLICKINSEANDSKNENESNAEESGKKYALLAVIKIDRIFIVDPSEGLKDLQRESTNKKIDSLLEIVEVGSTIHRLIFDNANEKHIWKQHLEVAIADIRPSFTIINKGTLYKHLLSSSNAVSIDEEVWPHNVSLLMLKNRACIYDDMTIVSRQNAEIEKLKEEVKAIQENKETHIEKSLKENESIKQLTKLCDSLRAQLEAEQKKRNELESKYENILNVVNTLKEQLESNKEEYQMYNRNLELELIRQREQNAQDMQKIMALIDNTPVRKVSQNVLLPNNKSFRKSKSKSNVNGNNVIDKEKAQESSESKDTSVKSPKLKSHISSPNLNKLSDSSKDSIKTKPRKLKSVKYNYSSEDPIPLKERIKKFGFRTKKREENQQHWRKSPVTTADSPVFINKPKKVDWIGVKGENYYSDDVTSDIDGFVYENQNMSYHSDYFSKNERTNPEREYLSDCSDFEYQEYQMIRKKDVF